MAVPLAYYSGMRMDEVFSLNWNQVNRKEGKLYLRAQDTKTDPPGFSISLVTCYGCLRSGSSGVRRSGLNAVGFVTVAVYALNPSNIPGGKPAKPSE